MSRAKNSDLAEIAGVNELVRHVTSISRQVYLIALNAMFMARKTDSRASGFATVTGELRSFSRQLNERMDGITVDIDRLIHVAARVGQATRRYRVMKNVCCKMSCEANSVSAVVLAGKEGRIKGLQDDFLRTKNAFETRLTHISKLCDVGENLAVLSKIESTGVGELSTSLRQISDQIDDTITQINDALDQARKRMSERNWESTFV